MNSKLQLSDSEDNDSQQSTSSRTVNISAAASSCINRPSTPTSSLKLLNKKVILSPLHPPQPKKPVINNTKILTVKTVEGNEIIRMLSTIDDRIEQQNARLNKIENNGELLKDKVNQLDVGIQLAANPPIPRFMGLRPNFIHFKNMKEDENLKDMDENAHQQLIDYLNNYRGGESLSASLRFILSKDRLFTDDFVAKLVYIQPREGKFVIGQTRVDHALYNSLKLMYPSLTIFLYQKAIQQALKAASARVKAREKSREKKIKNSGKSKKSGIQQEFYDGPYDGEMNITED
ncbi:uncharacterized protein LOC141533514 isoform X2 [Cotesia typhae]|uniref:uncharacterized protein LOC141533514 isoform X2 n=1 Tax=Cotesia typhae TaxID=2053667 RepID=UPI003D6853F5